MARTEAKSAAELMTEPTAAADSALTNSLGHFTTQSTLLSLTQSASPASLRRSTPFLQSVASTNAFDESRDFSDFDFFSDHFADRLELGYSINDEFDDDGDKNEHDDACRNCGDICHNR